MPYVTKMNDKGEVCVHKMENGKPMGESMGCHKSIKDARAQIAAIMASERDQRVHDAMMKAKKDA